MEVRAAKANELDEIVDMMCLAYRPESRPRFENHLRADSSYRLDQSRVCVVDGKIVSYVRVSNRPIRIGKAVVHIGGIGGVSTHPEHRHHCCWATAPSDSSRNGTRCEACSYRPIWRGY